MGGVPVGKIKLLNGQFDRSRLGYGFIRFLLEELSEFDNRLNRSFAVGAFFSDDESTAIILQSPGCDFGGRGTPPAGKNEKRASVGFSRIIIGALNDGALAIAYLDYWTFINEKPCHGDRFIKKPTPVFTKIQNHSIDLGLI